MSIFLFMVTPWTNKLSHEGREDVLPRRVLEPRKNRAVPKMNTWPYRGRGSRVAPIPEDFLQGGRPRVKGQQTSIHTQRAKALVDRSLQ